MKVMGEFPVHTLTKGLAAKAALIAEGKSEEEIATSLGETLKLKDNRLKLFMAALTVAEANVEKLYRIRIFMLNEGEKAPEKATQIEDSYYVPEFFLSADEKPAPPKAGVAVARGGGGKKDRPKGPKSSPWGLSPEEIAAKKEASLRAAEGKSK